MKKIRLFSLIFMTGLLTMSFSYFFPQESNIIRSILEKLENRYKWAPQQKVYLHLDKYSFNVDETIWYKAYVVNARDHTPDKQSKNLYIDLVNPSGFIVQNQLLKLDNGIAHGDFDFQDTITEGIYRIRAYTNWMQNFDEDYYFTREVYIKNPNFPVIATRNEVREIKKAYRQINKAKTKYDVSFFPEGGSLLEGIENKVGFKALNELGHGIKIQGELFDNKGTTILTFESNEFGMGTFKFTPEEGKKYKAEINPEELKENDFDLPDATEMGIVISLDHTGSENIDISLLTNLVPSEYPPNTIYSIIGHTRGVPNFTGEIDLKDEDRTLSIPKSLFPTGVTHFTLFNASPAPVSERLIFIHHDDQLNVKITTSDASPGKRDKVQAEMQITNQDGEPVDGNYSLSIYHTSKKELQGNIYSDLLLQSDIKGNIESPEYYFNNYNTAKEKELDNLMLTQGWRRFNWNAVLLNQKPVMPHNFEDGIEVTGRITRNFFNLPLKDIEVTLTILNEFNDVYKTRTDYKGRFFFKGLDYSDTISVRLEAEKENGSKNLVININSEDMTPIEDMEYVTRNYIRKPGPEGKWVYEEEEKEFDPFEEENNRINRIYSEPSSVVVVDETMRHYSNVLQILQGRVPGVSVTGNDIIIRGPSSFLLSNEPLFIIDGIPTSKESALAVSPHDIDRIEILKGPEAAIYGSRGGNGVIAIYTRRGKFMIRGRIDFGMLGYHIPKTFYSPIYDVRPDEEFIDDRTTLLWKPEITPGENGMIQTEFFTSDKEGTYVIELEGLAPSGKTASGKVLVEVN